MNYYDHTGRHTIIDSPTTIQLMARLREIEIRQPVKGGVVAIVNEKAGAADTTRDDTTRLIQEAFPDATVTFTDESSDVTELARTAVQQGARLVIAGGGDGTINAIASAVAGTETVLGLLPVGTLNHFARDLRIPLDVPAAIRTIAEGRVVAVDVGEVNGRIFLNNSGLGLYPGIVLLRERRQRAGGSKWPARVWATIKELSRYRLMTLHLTADGHAMVRTTPVVFVGNNEYLTEGMRVGTRDRIDQGVLSLFIPNHRGPFRLLWYSLRAVLGFADRRGEMDHLKVSELRIESGHRHLTVSIDGEVTRLEAPLHYRIRPGALRVTVPAPQPAA